MPSDRPTWGDLYIIFDVVFPRTIVHKEHLAKIFNYSLPRKAKNPLKLQRTRIPASAQEEQRNSGGGGPECVQQ